MAVTKKQYWLWGGVIVVLAAALFFVYFGNQSMPSSSKLPEAILSIGSTSIPVEIAATPDSRTQGLSDRISLAPDHGMLFVFQQNGDWGFWMKDMQFSIDIIFMGEKGEVSSVYSDVSPATFPKVFYPAIASRYVLELPAGFAAAHAITVNSKITIPSAVQAQSALQSE